MATPIATNDIVQIKFYCGQANQVGVNVTHWKIGTTGGTPNYDDGYAASFANTFAATYQDLLTGSATYYGCTLQRVGPGAVSVVYLPVGFAPVMGTAGAAPLPYQVSGLISLRTALAGRQYRGRIYPPFLDMSVDDGTGFADPAVLIADLQPLATLLQTSFPITLVAGNATFIPYLWSKGFARGNIVNAIPRGYYATQRRRGQTGRANTLPPF